MGILDAPTPTRAQAAAKAAVTPPPGFTWTANPLAGKLFIDQYGIPSTTFDPATRKHVGGVTYYVDVVTGNDANDGLTAGTALSSIAAACAKSDVGTVIVKGYGIATPYYRGKGFNNAAQAKNINIIGYNGGSGLPYVTTHDVLAFTLASGATKVYQSTRTNVTECMDMVGGAPGVRLVKVTGADNAAKIAACEALPGSWAQGDSGALYVHAADSRNLNTTNASRIWAMLNVPNFRNNGDYTSYLENLVLYGGVDCARVDGATSTGGQLTMVNVETGMSQAFNGNNVSVYGADSVLVNCLTSRSGQDGFNYHVLNGKTPKAIEINCRALECGHSASDQCSTSHDGVKIIRVGGTYRSATAAVIADVNGEIQGGTESWNIGCVADGAAKGYANWQAGGATDVGTATKMWLHGCNTAANVDNTNYSTTVYGGAQILSRGSRLERSNAAVAPY